MALTAQSIIDQTSTDIRQVLTNTGTSANIILGFVDRIHKDCLHTSVYSHLNRGLTSFNTVSGTSLYTLSANDIRRILTVFDRTANRLVSPMMSSMASPSPMAENALTPGSVPPVSREDHVAINDRVQSRYPEYYAKVGANSLYLFPTPIAADAIEVFYEKQVPTVAALNTTLTIPEDGFDMLVAGTNYMACQYLKKETEAQTWFQLYEKLKRGELLA